MLELKHRLIESMSETVDAMDNHEPTIKAIDKFVKNISDLSLHSINGHDTIEAITELVKGVEDQNIILDFVVLLNSTLHLNDVSDEEIISYLNTLIAIYPDKDTVGDNFIVNRSFIYNVRYETYDKVEHFYRLVTLIRLHWTLLVDLLDTKLQEIK